MKKVERPIKFRGNLLIFFFTESGVAIKGQKSNKKEGQRKDPLVKGKRERKESQLYKQKIRIVS
jgi:hypothetical protein